MIATIFITLALIFIFVVMYVVHMYKKTVPKPRPKPLINNELYTYETRKVVGVTFKNIDGGNRQAILKKVYLGRDEFETINITLNHYKYKGEDAIGVYINNNQIGNISKDDIEYLIDNWNGINNVININIYGGGETSTGEMKSYGAEIIIEFKKTE